jgi:hypothetical protein
MSDNFPEQPADDALPPGPAPRRDFALDVPAEAEVGVYADFASIWHTPETFVLDFAVLKRPPQTTQHPDGSSGLLFPTRVVSRVRLPPAQIFELMKALEQQLTMWETEHGRAQPGQPG